MSWETHSVPLRHVIGWKRIFVLAPLTLVSAECVVLLKCARQRSYLCVKNLNQSYRWYYHNGYLFYGLLLTLHWLPSDSSFTLIHTCFSSDFIWYAKLTTQASHFMILCRRNHAKTMPLNSPGYVWYTRRSCERFPLHLACEINKTIEQTQLISSMVCIT